MGRNANFSGAGFPYVIPATWGALYHGGAAWVDEVHETASPLTEDKFEELLEPGHLGKSTYTGTHLEFSPAPSHHGPTDTEELEPESQESTNTDSDEQTKHDSH